MDASACRQMLGSLAIGFTIHTGVIHTYSLSKAVLVVRSIQLHFWEERDVKKKYITLTYWEPITVPRRACRLLRSLALRRPSMR